MRITIVMGPFLPLPPGPGGAVERIWLGLAERFAEAGHEVTVLSRTWEGLNNDETINGVHHRRLTAWRSTGNIAFDLVKDFLYSLRIRREVRDSDITVTNVFWLPAFLSKRNAGKIVVNVNRFPKRQIWLYRRTAWLAVSSQAVQEAVLEQTPSVERITSVLSNPIECDVFVPGPPTPPKETKTILYTGRVHPEKGIDLLIDAFAKISTQRDDVTLRIMGPWTTERGGGGQEFVDELKRRSGDAPVEFCEPIYGREALASELRSADVYAYPSCADKGESFGVAPVEAMACGTPPVVSGLACFRDFIEDGVNGLVFQHRDPDAVDQLAERLTRLLDDPELRKRLGDAGAERAKEFSYDHIASFALKRFEHLVAQS